MKYKICVYIEESDDHNGIGNDIETEFCLVGPEFDYLEEAQDFKDKMINNME